MPQAAPVRASALLDVATTVGRVCGMRRRYARRWPASSAGGSGFASPPRVTPLFPPRMRSGWRSAHRAMAPARAGRYARIVERRRLRLTGVGSRITRAGDVLIPVALAGMSLTEIWIARFAQPGFHGPRGVQTVGALLMTVSLGWRRRYPVAVLACVTLGAAVEWPWGRASGQVSLEAFLAIVIAYYSVGAHVERRR